MNRIATLLILIVTTTTMCYAQPKSPKTKRTSKIEQFVSGLSATQKKKIEQLHKETCGQMSTLRREQKQVRDSIAMYNDRYGDYSAILYPLYEREAKLQIAISKHFYAKKVALDKILTKEQHEEFVSKMEMLRNRRLESSKKK